MSPVRQTWQALGPVSKIVAVGLPIALVAIVAGGVLAFASLGGSPTSAETDASPLVVAPGATPPALPPDPTPDPAASPPPSPTPTPQQADPVLGTDGRLTVLLLGSDYRPAHPGNRTDAILVVSVDPASGAAAGFSIPRDTVEFPMPEKGTYGPKVNGLYQHLHSTTGQGGRAMKAAIARAYGLEVDNYVFIGFEGFKRLISAIGGVDVTLKKAYYDPYYWVNNRTQGWGLPAGKSHLSASEALIFARSRKGDNDFERARRQQLLIMAVVDKVRRQGIDRLPRLLAIARDTVRTDLPLDRAPDIYKVIATTDISGVDRVVFGPRTYADARGGSSFAPDLAAQRAWIAKHFPPPRPFAAWPAEPKTASAAEPAAP
jgi:LCP family protein required for cell wall assembly